MENFEEYLRRLLEEFAEKQKEIQINLNLARICRDLDSFSAKISDCLSKGIDLPQTDVDSIQALNKEYNAEFDKYKNLKGL